MNDFMTSVPEFQVPTTPEEAFAFLQSIGPAMAVMVIAVLMVWATWSWRLFKLVLPCAGAVIFSTVGGMAVPFAVEALGSNVIGPVNVNAAVVFVCAILGAILMGVLYKLGLIVIGAFAGWTIGSTVNGILAASNPDVEFFQSVEGNLPMGQLVIGIICAIILGILAIFIFKALYIVICSVGCMTAAGCLAGVTLASFTDEISMYVIYAMTVVGVIAGVFCAVHQFKTAND